jgi:hypothetical protein
MPGGAFPGGGAPPAIGPDIAKNAREKRNKDAGGPGTNARDLVLIGGLAVIIGRILFGVKRFISPDEPLNP